MDATQIAIIISLLSVSAIVVACGIYFIRLLRDIQQTVKRTNLILDEARSITSSVVKPLVSFSEFVMGFKNGLSVFNQFFKKKKKEKTEDKNI